MIDASKSVNNPLTVVAIFAALAEVAGTVALAMVDKSLQPTFVWFVMGFPTLLVLLFFVTLNFNPKVLYAPSDFRNEDNFLNTLLGTRAVGATLDQLTAQFDDAKKNIVEHALAQIKVASVDERERLRTLIDAELREFEVRLDIARKEVETAEAEAVSAISPHAALEARVAGLLSLSAEGMTIAQLAAALRMSTAGTERALSRLLDRRVITRTSDRHGVRYSLGHQSRPGTEA